MSKHGNVLAEDGATSLQVGGEARLKELERRLLEAEEALRISSGKLRMASDVSKLGAWERDLATGEIVGNPAFKQALGLPIDTALTYEQMKEMFHRGDIERIDQAVANALKTKTDFNIEHRILRPDGHVGWVLVRGSALYDGGRPVRLIGVIQDISEREKAKAEVHHAQRRQEFLLELNDRLGSVEDPHEIVETTARSLANFLQVDSAGYGEVHEDRQVVIVEREWSKGLISNEGRVQPFSQIPPFVMEPLRQGLPVATEDVKTDPNLQDPAMQAFYSSINVRTILSVPLHKNGQWRAVIYVSSSAPRSWDSDQLALVEDVAERTWIALEKVRAEISLRETEARFRIIAESLPALVWIVKPNLELTYTNERWVRYSGLPAEEALGHSWMASIHPDDMARMHEELKPVMEHQIPYTTEARYRSSEGVYRWHLIQAAPVNGASGEFKGWCGTSVDIHDIKETQEALRRNEDQLRLALTVAKMGDWSWDAVQNVVTLSDRSAEIFGLPHGYASTREELDRLMHPADLPRIHAAIQEAVENRTRYSLEHRIRRADTHAQAWVSAQAQGIYGQDGSLLGITGVVQDITDRKHAEERQQLLIRELHHRVKNTLATVQAIVGSTARTASSIDEFYQGFVGRIVSLARTHNLLTEDLWQKASLQELIQTELGPYEDEARNHVIIEGPPVELPSEAAVPIGMAIHELTTNAAKHGALSTFGGQVNVKWRIEPGPERPMLHFSWTEHGGPHVTAPSRQGFGSRLLQRVLATQLQAQVNMDFPAEGLRFTMVLPIPGEPPIFNPDK